eukprot:PhF_6_TR32168/c0_g1_i2/m.47725
MGNAQEDGMSEGGLSRPNVDETQTGIKTQSGLPPPEQVSMEVKETEPIFEEGKDEEIQPKTFPGKQDFEDAINFTKWGTPEKRPSENLRQLDELWLQYADTFGSRDMIEGDRLTELYKETAVMIKQSMLSHTPPQTTDELDNKIREMFGSHFVSLMLVKACLMMMVDIGLHVVLTCVLQSSFNWAVIAYGGPRMLHPTPYLNVLRTEYESRRMVCYLETSFSSAANGFQFLSSFLL